MATRKRPQTAGGSGEAGPPAPTTTVPATTALSAEDQALVEAIKGQLPSWLFNTNESKLEAIGQAGVQYVDKATGRVIRYEGITKPLPSGEGLQPQYFEGDEYNISALDPVDIRDLQTKLLKGGFFLGDRPTIGTVGPETIKAYYRALEQANLNFTDVDTVINNAQKVPYSGGAGGSLPKYRITSSSDLAAVFDRASQSVLGRTLDQEEVNKLVKAYQGVEVGALKNRQQVSAQAPQAQTFGVEQIENQNEDEAMAYKFSQYAQAFEQLLGQ